MPCEQGKFAKLSRESSPDAENSDLITLIKTSIIPDVINRNCDPWYNDLLLTSHCHCLHFGIPVREIKRHGISSVSNVISLNIRAPGTIALKINKTRVVKQMCQACLPHSGLLVTHYF